MNSVARWWLIFCAMVTGFIFLFSTGLVNFAWHADHSKLGFVALGIFALVTPFIGFLTDALHRRHRWNYKKYLPACWFASDAAIAIGMMGTLAGIMMMFTQNMSHINFNDLASVRHIIVKVSVGFSTAIITTFLGLISSLLIRLQLVSLEVDLPENPVDPEVDFSESI